MARKVVVWEHDGEAGSAECYSPHQGPARAYLSQIQLLGLHILLCCSYPSPLLGMQGWEEGLTARVLLPGRICFSSVFSQKIIVSEVQRKLLLKSCRHSTAPPYQREPCGWSSQLQISGSWVCRSCECSSCTHSTSAGSVWGCQQPPKPSLRSSPLVGEQNKTTL